MYPFYRYSKTIVSSIISERKGKKLTLNDVGEVTFTCNPSDIDNFLEMNNGRVLTLFDLGRTDFAIRSGLGYQLIKNRWSLVVAGSTIQYRKRVRAFDEVTIKTKIVGMQDSWVYIEQSMWVKDVPCSSVLLRTGITKNGKVIDTNIVLNAIGMNNHSFPENEFLNAWIEADKLRPWPPQV